MAASLTVFSYSRCSTCRKALAWLDAEGLDYTVVDITVDPPSRDLLQAAAQQFGDRKPLFNTSGQSYRAMGAAVVKALSDDEALEALAADGKLIKRPFVEVNSSTYLTGFKPDLWESALQG